MKYKKQMNKLSSSVSLNDEIMEAKTKYAKAMNDFIANKDKAIGRKMDIAKLMTEIHKFNGDVKSMAENEESVGNWENLKSEVYSVDDEAEDKTEKENYKIDF